MESVISMLQNNRYLHLGTCKDNIPSVSLMNFVYVDGVVVLTSPQNTSKLANLEANPNVSLLVHELIAEGDTPLSDYLKKLNQSCLTLQKSATITGTAEVATGEIAELYRRKHLKAHPDAECFISKAAIIVVKLKSARIADNLNHVETVEF